MKRAIHWFQRDLRTTDNTALAEATRQSEMVLPVFVLEDALRTGPDVGGARLAFLLRSVKALKDRLRQLGYPLVVRLGKSTDVIPALAQEFRAEAVFCNRRYEPYCRARESRLYQRLDELSVRFEVHKDAVTWEMEEILTGSGTPYTVFTPYARVWRSRKRDRPRPPLQPGPQRWPRIRSDPLTLDPAEFGHPVSHPIPPAGEDAALECWRGFRSNRLRDYHKDRNFPSLDGTSRLSAHLRAGTIGIRQILAELADSRARAGADWKAGCDAFLGELIWREFYLQILANFPHVARESFRPAYRELRWSENEAHFQAWAEGRTGYPIVDAAMRCLNATGWMHNRLRMITATFLVKDLLLNWQWGERYFMQRLIDGDLAANNGGWQWSAGTGTDAAPYFRIFNPIVQGRRFDPAGAFIRQWIPELRDLTPPEIHEPWKAARIGPAAAYPRPVVVHEDQKKKWLDLMKRQVLRNERHP